ncbi:MAG: tetratricopeptide repeat protein [Armatimonadota bacterium]
MEWLMDGLRILIGLGAAWVIGIGLVALVRHWHDILYIDRPLRQATEASQRGDQAGALAILERTVQVRPWSSPPALCGVHLLLGTLYAAEQQHERAVEHYRALLQIVDEYRLPELDGITAEANGNLSDSLEMLGEHEKAEEIRRQALSLLHGELADPLIMGTRGKLLEGMWRHREAVADFARALELGQHFEPQLRLDLCARAALASYECGRQEDTLRFAKQGLELGQASYLTSICASMAGVAAGILVRPDESTAYYRRAYDLAMAEQDTANAAGALVMMGMAACSSGRLEEFLAQIEEAERLSSEPDARRSVLSGRYEYLFLRGQFDEGRDVLRQLLALAYPRGLDPRNKHRGTALFFLAHLETAVGNHTAARAALDEAQAILLGHEKHDIWCRHLSARIAAMAGETERALAEIAVLEEQLPILKEDWETYPTCLGDLGKACCRLGEYDRAVAFLQRCPDERIRPVYRPDRWYHLGKCYRMQGNLPAAREAYAKAAHVGFETYYTRLAADRLHDSSR